MYTVNINPSATGNNFSSWDFFFFNVSAKNRPASFLSTTVFPFPSILLTVLENDAAKGKTCETTEYKLSKAIVQNFYGTYTVPPVWGAIVSTVRTLYPHC